MSTPEDYQAKADEALAQLAEATSEAERQRLRRAHGAYLKLASHGAEAAARAAMRPPPKPRPEKQAPPPRPGASYFK
ncbi:MAG TPA: hypothetical protein VEA60_02900 [Allosphingosinicella sp.]|nr:hypothetical protein [Allosphingosinicella sp.]